MKSNRPNTLLAVLLTLVLTVSCNKDKTPGSKASPLKIFFTPSLEAQTIATNSQEFVKFMEKETGLYFETAVPASYVAVVEAFGSSRADVAVMNSFSYLMANEKYGAQARLMVLRHGEKFYRGQIITYADSGINKIEDLKGKNFAFVDSASTSGYLFPLKMLREKNVELGNTTFAMKHDTVVTMVYQKQVDAGATYYSPPGPDGLAKDARERVKTQFPDVEEKVKIIGLTDEIPNDPFVFRKDLPPAVTDKIIVAITKYLTTDEGKRIFKNIYDVDGLVPATDADYDVLRKMVSVNKIDPAEMLNKKKK